MCGARLLRLWMGARPVAGPRVRPQRGRSTPSSLGPKGAPVNTKRQDWQVAACVLGSGTLVYGVSKGVALLAPDGWGGATNIGRGLVHICALWVALTGLVLLVRLATLRASVPRRDVVDMLPSAVARRPGTAAPPADGLGSPRPVTGSGE